MLQHTELFQKILVFLFADGRLLTFYLFFFSGGSTSQSGKKQTSTIILTPPPGVATNLIGVTCESCYGAYDKQF